MKKLILFIYIFAVTSVVTSQEIESQSQAPIQVDEPVSEKATFKSKLYTGGNFGLTFGTYTNIMVAPLLGIRWSPKFSTELGVEYNYTKDNRYDTKFSQYGGRVNAQYFVIPQLFAQAEFAELSIEHYKPITNINERNFVPFLYLGAGYRQYMSKRSFVSFRIMFDVLNNENSPYSRGEPYFSVGFGVGI